jgi:hypothetical protein
MAESTNPPRLPEHDKLNEFGEKPYQAEPDMEKQAVESNGPSTIASSTANGSGKLETPEDDSSATGEKATEEPAKAVEYPKGLQMFFIMLALLLSITLCALDQVSSAPTSPSYRFVLCQCIIRQYADILNPDHRCNRHPKND